MTTTFWYLWGLAQSSEINHLTENWPAVGLLSIVGAVVFGAFRTGFVRFGSEVKELLAEKDARIREILAEKETRIHERDERIAELVAEMAATRRAVTEAQDAAKSVAATNAKATRTLEAIAATMVHRNQFSQRVPPPAGPAEDGAGET